MLGTLNSNIGQMERSIKKIWITQDLSQQMTERRKHKNINTVEYTRLNNKLRRKTDRVKEKFINETCVEITKLLQTVIYDLRYHTIKA